MVTENKCQYTILRPGMGSRVGVAARGGALMVLVVDLGGPLPYHGASNLSLFPTICAMQRNFGGPGTESFSNHHEHIRAL